MKKQYIIARYFKGCHVETMCEPTTKKRMPINDVLNFKKTPLL